MNPCATEFLDSRVRIIVGDITQENVDAIVNAANQTLLGGGGVDGAIHRAGGPAILEACQKLRQTEYPNGLPTGAAVMTTAGNLPARFVIHTVGPIYRQENGREAALLAACYHNSLALAVARDLTTITFPAISTGAFYYPRHEAAAISSRAIKSFLAQNATLKEVRLIFLNSSDAEVYSKHQNFI